MSNAFFEALKSIPAQQKVEPEYRLYYNPKSGEPLFYTSVKEQGTYIVVDKDTYTLGNYHCVIKDGKILNNSSTGTYRKLVPSNTGVTTHKDNVMIIAEKGQNWATKTYGN